MSTITLFNPDATRPEDLGVADMIEWNLSEALSAIGASESLLRQLPEPVQTAVRISLKLARTTLETAQRELVALSPEPDGDAPTGVAKNIPIPLGEDEQIALQVAA